MRLAALIHETKHVRHINNHLVQVPHQEHVLPKIPDGLTVRDMIKE